MATQKNYPGGIDSFQTWIDDVDIISAAAVNDLGQQIVAIETELGTDVAGSMTDLKTRLAVSINDDGTLKGTAVGATGLQGEQGETGLQGIQGDTGVQGLKGVQGDTGVQGETGLQGPQGDTGTQGNTGVQGITGVFDSAFFADLKEITGFLNNSNINVSYNSTTRRITLTGSSMIFYWRGTKVWDGITSWVSNPHNDVNGEWYLYYDGTAFVWSDTIWTYNLVQIAHVCYSINDKFAITEVHGLMQWQSHEELHAVIGTYKTSGGSLNGYTIPPTTDAHNRPGINSCILADEDLYTTLPLLADGGPYTQVYLDGAGATTTFVLGATDIVPLNGDTLTYNKFSEGVWSQAEVFENNYINVWLIAQPTTNDTSSQAYRYLWVQGQKEHFSLSSVQLENPKFLNLGSLSVFFQEYNIIARIVLKRTGSLVGKFEIVEVREVLGTRVTPSLINPYVLDGRAVGTLTYPQFTDNGNGSFTIAMCEVYLRDNSNHEGAIEQFTIPEATLTCTDGLTQFIVAEYNSGSPRYTLYDYPNYANGSDSATVGTVWRMGNTLHKQSYDKFGLGLANKLSLSLLYCTPYRIPDWDHSSLVTEETITPNPRTVLISGGKVFAGVNATTVSNFNSSTNNFYFFYRVNGLWNYSVNSVYNNIQYDDGTNLQTLSNNHYGVRWIYRAISIDTEAFYICDNINTKSLYEAQQTTPPISIPNVIKHHCMLVGRAIVEYNATNGIIESVLRTPFAGNVAGPIGDTGIQGNTGLQGIQGENGIQGVQGQTGVQGDTGINGIKGDTGIQGIQGVTGLRGQLNGTEIDLSTTNFDNKLTSTENTVQKAIDVLDDHTHIASEISVVTSNFGKELTSSENTVQKALDKLDDHIHEANETTTSVTNFVQVLTSADTTVQKALDTLDNYFYEQYWENESVFSTTSGSYQQAFTATTDSLLAGNYIISFMLNMRGEYILAQGTYTFRVQIDNTTNIIETTLGRVNNGDYIVFSGFRKLTLTAATHVIDVDIKASSGTMRVSSKRIEIRRVK